MFPIFTGMSETAVRLLLRMPYIMPLYYSMNIFELRDPEMPTLATDGVSMWVNPDFWNQLNRDQRVTAVAHEIGHKMLLHSTRRYERDPEVWNWAGDLMINPMLVQSGFTPLTGLIIDGKPWSWMYDEKYVDPKWTTESVYDDIIKEFEKNGQKGKAPSQAGSGSAQGSGRDGKPAPGGGTAQNNDQPATGQQRASEHAKRVLGPFRDLRDFGTNPDGSKADNTPSVETHEQQVRKEIKEAEAQAKMAGNTPAWIERVVGNAFHAKVNWHEVLEQYLRGLHQSDYSWSRMNRRDFVKTGVISPDMYQPAMGGVLKIIDTSGSVSARELALYDKHMKDVLEQVRPKWTAIAYWDTQLHRLDRFERSEYELDSSMMHPVGGGGTDFRGFQFLVDDLEEPPEIILVYTDMFASFPRQELSAPTIWLSTSSINTGPFGQVICIN